MIGRRTLLAGAAALPGAGLPALAGAAPAPRTLIGTYGGAGCTGVPKVAEYEKWLGRKLDLVLDFLQMDSWTGMVNEAGWAGHCWQQAGRRELVMSVPLLVGQGGPTLEQGATGAFDAQFRALAGKMIETGHADAILRIGWEFNGGWYPWTARGKPQAFAAAWRRAAMALRSTPGAKFRFDWCPTTVDGPTEQAWPGDDVVDFVGLDVYNQSWPFLPDPERRWDWLMHNPAGLAWHRQFAQAHGKMRSFPEWGTGTRPDGHGGGDDPLFIRNMLGWMRDSTPHVYYACYWNYPASDYNALLTNGQYPKAAAALRAGLNPRA